MQVPVDPRRFPLKNPRGPHFGTPAANAPGALLCRSGEAAELLGCQARQFAYCSVSRILKWYNPAIHGTPMMARAAAPDKLRPLLAKLFSGRRINNLQAKEKIFEQSVAQHCFTRKM